MMIHIGVLLVGFTVLSAIILLFAYWYFLPDLQKSIFSKVACTLLLTSLAGLQWCHYLAFSAEFDALNNAYYLWLLLAVPAFFYYFSLFVLFPSSVLSGVHAVHLCPLLTFWLLPVEHVPLIAFVLGTGYTFWFARLVLVMRHQHQRFHFERFFFVLFAIFAAIALALGFLIPHIDAQVFYVTYGSSIGDAMVLVVTAMIIFPDMLTDIQQIAELAYAKSSLGSINIKSKKDQLDQLMMRDKVYQNEELSLAMVADMMQITPHQLSELVNTQYGHGFSRLVRTCRVEYAQRLLEDEPQTSVLAISLMTGFKSQSNFYAAFKEVTGESPGNYRKRIQK